MTDHDSDELFYRNTESMAFPKLDDLHLAALEPLGRHRVLHRGDPLFHAGERDPAMAVVVTGEIEVFDLRDGQEMILAQHGPRDFVGDVAMLDGTSAVSSARAGTETCEILEIPAPALRRALAELPGVGEMLTQAFIMRRQRLQRDRDFAGLRIVADADCQEGRQIDDFLDKNHIPHRYIGSESSDGVAIRARYGLAHEDLPTLITNEGKPLHKPSIRDVAQTAGLLRPLTQHGEKEVFYDLVVVGGGPAGLSAAVNAASEGLRTMILEAYAPGGQAASSSLIENFFGFPTGISGGELTKRAQLQAYRFGAKFSTPSRVLSLALSDEEYRASLRLEDCAATLRAKCLLIATGADYRRIEAEGREKYERLGVYYAATAMEAKQCGQSTVIVAGGGNSAGQAAMFLSEVAAKVLLVIRGDNLAKSMSSYLSRRVETRENIEILRCTEIRRMSGSHRLEEVELENMKTGERRTVAACAVFSMIGANPRTDWVPAEIERDEKGFVKTGDAVVETPIWQKVGRHPGPLETSFPGVYAAGDVRSGSVKRCSAAVGEGGMAVEEVHRFLRTYA